MKNRNKYLLTIPNCPQNRSIAKTGKITMRIFSFGENHETGKKEKETPASFRYCASNSRSHGTVREGRLVREEKAWSFHNKMFSERQY